MSRILLAASAWLVLEFVFAAYTGKQYGKNLIPALMPMMIAMGAFFHFVTENASDSRASRLTLHIASAVVACFTLALSASQFRENAKAAPGSAMLLVPEVQQLTSPSECAAFWGIFPPEVIFASRRPACTRFFSSIPLAHAEATYRLLAPLALDDLERSRPKLIVQHDDGQVPPLTGQTKDIRGPSLDWDTPALIERKSRLMQAYRLAWSDPRGLTVIYERR